jgi:hypothetical protein
MQLANTRLLPPEHEIARPESLLGSDDPLVGALERPAIAVCSGAITK